MKKRYLFILSVFPFLLSGCKKENSPTPAHNLIIKIKFDGNQQRLNGVGQSAPIPQGNAGLSPLFNGLSIHYAELSPNANTLLGKGAVIYRAAETKEGGENAIDFSKATIAKDGDVFLTVPLNQIPANNYEWFRISIAYQNYDVTYHIDNYSGINVNADFTGTIASFIGFNTYIKDLKVKNSNFTVNGNKKQGFWAFETKPTIMGVSNEILKSGQAPEGATTVVNPLFNSSPIPAGSCVVTAELPGKLTITGNESKDIVVEVSLSTNKSFEWKDINQNGKWDPLIPEPIVDMGVRGMKCVIK